MHRILALAAVALMTLASSISAQAQGGWVTTVTSPTKWSGCYIGVQGGYSATSTDTSIDAVGFGSILSTGLSSQGGAAGVHAGCDVQIQQLVIGAYADYNWHNQSISIDSALLGGNIARLDFDNAWTIGGRAGIVFGNSLIYGKAGWTRAGTSDLSVLNGAASFAVPTLDGWSFGGGISTEVMPNIKLSAEYVYTKFDRVDVALIPGSIGVGLQPDMHTAMARLSYSFDLSRSGLK